MHCPWLCMTATEPIVFIIDDDISARRGLTRLVRAAGMQTQSFASADDFLAREGECGPGCIVLDVQMPGVTGPELHERLRKAEYSLPVIFLSAHGDVPMTARAMKNGAVDFLTKPVDRDELLGAISTSIARDAENRSRSAEVNHLREKLQSLTEREHEIMTYVITGMLNKQIAAHLEIAEDTVKIHRGRVMHKLGIGSVAELVRLCERANIEPATEAGSG